MKRGAIVLALLLAAGPALAQDPFGIGAVEPAGGGFGGPFAPLFAEIARWQSDFYRQLTDALGQLREDGTAFLVLAGVSFLYGIFHAAGPGHGKAVVTAYLLASGQTLRRGIVIAFASAFVQAVTAIALVGIAAGILNVTAVTMTDATRVLEIGSYALIALVGVWLLATRLRGHSHAHAYAGAGSADDPHAGHAHAMPAGPVDGRAFRAEGTIPAQAPHLHAPDPSFLRRPLTLATAWTAVIAVGIRPCSGAIIVLVFALAQGVFAAGIASTFVMAVGTAITVALLASLAVLARDFALRLTGGRSRALAIAGRVIEIAGALAVLALGLVLLGGALAG
ncbi:MAG: nickel/cobalt transporter [Bauldia sp.]|nr:nickel/cobalt transporter [Bauldia sp.]